MTLDPRSAAALFSPRRLTQARQMLAITRAELARRADVSAAAISQYETGSSRPRPSTLAQLALVLNVPLAFLTESTAVTLPDVQTSFFRSLRRSTQRDRERAVAFAGLLAQLVVELEQRVTLPPFEPFPAELALDPNDDPARAESAADTVRTLWRLEPGKITNVVRLLEHHGVIVARLPLSEDVDAFSWAGSQRPLVLLGDDKRNYERSRFDAAHELAHIVMHVADPEPANPAMERQAHRFAGALLIPAEAMHDEWPRGRWDWNDLVRIKQRWGISMGALLLRARDIGLLSPDGYVSKIKYVSRMGWRRKEPGPQLPPEQPDLLNQAIGLLTVNGVSIEQIAEHGNLLSANALLRDLCLTPHPPLRLDR